MKNLVKSFLRQKTDVCQKLFMNVAKLTLDFGSIMVTILFFMETPINAHTKL
jgi:hypothetical protein